jgi:hypothetical protein
MVGCLGIQAWLCHWLYQALNYLNATTAGDRSSPDRMWGRLKTWFSALFLVDGSQFFANGIDDEFMGGDAAGLAISFNALYQNLRNFQAKGFILRTVSLFAHRHTISALVKMDWLPQYEQLTITESPFIINLLLLHIIVGTLKKATFLRPTFSLTPIFSPGAS